VPIGRLIAGRSGHLNAVAIVANVSSWPMSVRCDLHTESATAGARVSGGGDPELPVDPLYRPDPLAKR
jgi:hypothetical protein